MKRITRDHVTYLFGPGQQPVAQIAPGELAVFETLDARGGRAKSRADLLTLRLPRTQLNPATGPVRVVGARPGHTLGVTIVDIQMAELSGGRVMDAGVIRDELQLPAGVMARVQDGIIHFNECIHFAARPMVGVVGVAPAGAPVASFYPGAHGGNLDINAAGVGSTVYLPVTVPGALLAIGDVHASMGDGELTGGGLDINAEVTVLVGLHSGLDWPRPVIETGNAWCTCANGPNLAEAIRQATSDMTTLLAQRLHLSREEAFILIGAAGDARIGQSAGLAEMDVTAYVQVGKEILPTAY